MVDFGTFRNGFISQVPQIREVQNLHLSQLSADDARKIRAILWKIISGLNVGIGETKIVSGSKALHHVLPELVPPIDRQYTARFFHHKTFNQGDQSAFMEMFPKFHQIARDSVAELGQLLGQGWISTSSTKLIDNAIVGWVIEHYGVEEPDDAVAE